MQIVIVSGGDLDAIGSALRGVAEWEAKSPRIVTHRLDAGHLRRQCER